MNLKYKKVSLFEISYKKKITFHNINFSFLDVPVYRLVQAVKRNDVWLSKNRNVIHELISNIIIYIINSI